MLNSALVSNGYQLPIDQLGRLVPTNPNASIDRLRAEYQLQGYLWLKGILNREKVLAFRAEVLRTFAATGLVQPGTDYAVGVYGGLEGPEAANANKILMEVVRWAAYEAFCLSEPIIAFYAALFEGAPYLHKRKILRYTRPGIDKGTTGAHYDLTYLRGGTDRVCTSWIPIGDCPVEMGGLVYLENSDAWGRSLEAGFCSRNASLPRETQISAYNKNMTDSGWLGKDLMTIAEGNGSRWLVADYEAGDMVVHSPYMVHAATANYDPLNRVRLSTDIRYQRVRDEIDVRWANHWSLDDML